MTDFAQIEKEVLDLTPAEREQLAFKNVGKPYRR